MLYYNPLLLIFVVVDLIPMRISIVFFQLLLLFLCGPVVAQSDESVMSDLKLYEQSLGSEQVAYANSFMNKLYQAEFIDHLQRYDTHTSLDTIRKHIYFAATEYSFYELADYKQAIHYGLLSLETMKSCHDMSSEGACESMLAIAYFRQSNYVEALKHAHRDLSIQRKKEDASSISSALNTIAGIYLASRNEKEALEYVQQAICLNQLGTIENIEHRYDEAAKSFQKALAYFTAHHDLLNELGARQGLAVALRESAPTEAMAHLERISVLKDSLYDREMEAALSKAHASFKNEQLVSENEHHKIEKRLFVIAAVALLAVLGFIFAYLLLLVRKYRRIAKEDKQLAEEVKSMDDEVVLNPEEKLFIRKLNEFIDMHMDDLIEVDALASYLSLGRKQLNRRLYQIIGCNACTYIVRRRIDRACDLLLNSTDRISSIALSCGFDNPSNFARTFKEVQGCPPSVYRKEHLVR